MLLPLIGTASLPASSEQGRNISALPLMPGASQRDIVRHMWFLEDPSREMTLADARAAAADKAFQPIRGDYIDFGYSHSRYWLRLPLRNAGDRTGVWLLSFNVRFMQGLDAYIVREGKQARRLLRDSRDMAFDQRAQTFRILNTSLSLARGERATLYIGYWSGGSTSLPISFETEQSFLDMRAEEMVKHAVFYAILGLNIFYAFIALPIMRTKVLAAYVVYLLSVTLFMLQMDGYAFEYLWPFWPGWNAFAALPLGYMLGVAAAVFARVFLRTGRHSPGIDWLLKGVIGSAVLFVLAGLVIGDVELKKFGSIYIVLSACICLSAGIWTMRVTKLRGLWFYIIGWSGVVLAAILAAIIHWVPGLAENYRSYDLARIAMFLDVVMMAMAILAQLNGLRQQRDMALSRELSALRQKLALDRHILALQEKYAVAQGLAVTRGMQLASAGHDLRQPLLTLRATMQKLMQKQETSGDEAAKLTVSLEYLEQIIIRYLETEVDLSGAANADLDAIAAGAASVSEVFQVNVVFDNLRSMFSDEAQAQQVDLRVMPSENSAEADPLVVMRIMSNLVSNAVKYVPNGRVLVGCRRHGPALSLEVHDDGPGLDEREIDRLFKIYERGHENGDAEGLGLGLAIASSLARKHGYMLDVRPRMGRGTYFRLILPKAQTAS